MLTYLGFGTLDEWDGGFGMGKDGFGFWIVVTEEKYQINKFHRKGTGVNHVAFLAESKEAVDKFHQEFLKPRAIKTLYNTPKLFPEYRSDYYAVYFEDLDRIKLEVVFHS